MRVCLLHQPGKQSGVWFPVLGFTESGDHAFDGGARCNFALLISTHAIRQNEKPPMRTGLRWTRRGRIAKIIFIMLADSPDVGSFREL